mmetsp:Transcript_42231/g.97759  ORF Transcript_42231/g.97759 Transcript_42231/m.97759 type:complete len:306 (+) Transcript_42231:70-987(+)
MGNGLPSRCVAPCHPQCCAVCIHGDANRTEEEEEHAGSRHKAKGTIFANAASVLSMAAEEISLDDHLEKELANEVELWRMESSNTAVQMTAVNFSVHGKGTGVGAVSGAATNFVMPFAEQPAARDRSVSPPPRTQVSLHNRIGGGVVAGNGTRHSSSSTNDPAAPVDAKNACAGSALASAGLTRSPPAEEGGGDAAAGLGVDAEDVRPSHDMAEAVQARWTPPQAAVGLQTSQPLKALPSDCSRVDSASSSDESTFVGFIEDPLEKERCGEAAAVQVWVSESPDDRSHALMSEVDGVRNDRSIYF